MIRFGIMRPSNRGKYLDDNFFLQRQLLQRKNQKKSLSYNDKAKFEIAKEKIDGGTVEFEINSEELFAINDLKEN